VKVVKKTGLVPVVSSKGGPIFGVAPDKAREMVKAGLATFAVIPDHIETFEVADGKKAAAAPTAKEEYAVVIQEDWETLHHLQKVKLAKTLGFETVKTVKEAVEVISQEIQRRAAAETSAE
jgi:hypothetical protein